MLANLDGEGEPVLVPGKRVYAHEVVLGDTQATVVRMFRFDRAAKKLNKEVVFHGDPALLAPQENDGRKRSGIPAMQCDCWAVLSPFIANS